MIKTRRERDKTWSETLKEEATLVISEFEWNCHCCSTEKAYQKENNVRETRQARGTAETLHDKNAAEERQDM